ncbi:MULTISPECIES: hypothetical protein [Desulfococcus]|jgi:hypothetical protein|nr:hypothetical protein [Desulfococcus multivorans]AQV00133.1 hypothetical protein B2D07_04675 [Desulfococcus multivorans]
MKQVIGDHGLARTEKKTGVTPGEYAMMAVIDTGCGMGKNATILIVKDDMAVHRLTMRLPHHV